MSPQLKASICWSNPFWKTGKNALQNRRADRGSHDPKPTEFLERAICSQPVSGSAPLQRFRRRPRPFFWARRGERRTLSSGSQRSALGPVRKIRARQDVAAPGLTVSPLAAKALPSGDDTPKCCGGNSHPFCCALDRTSLQGGRVGIPESSDRRALGIALDHTLLA